MFNSLEYIISTDYRNYKLYLKIQVEFGVTYGRTDGTDGRDRRFGKG